MVEGGANDIAIMAAIVAFRAGYITTQRGQDALKAATKARYFAPIDVFVFSSLLGLCFALMSKRLIILKEWTTACMMLACSSIGDILLYNRGCFAWTVYVPPALAFIVMAIPDCVTKSLFKGVGAIQQLLGCISGSATSALVPIPETLSANLDEDTPV